MTITNTTISNTFEFDTQEQRNRDEYVALREAHGPDSRKAQETADNFRCRRWPDFAYVIAHLGIDESEGGE